jgi:hypothetical protein
MALASSWLDLGAHTYDNVWANIHNGRNSMAGEPVGRIRTGSTSVGRTMRSRYTDHRVPSVVDWSSPQPNSAGREATGRIPQVGEARLPGIRSKSTRTVTLARVKKDRSRITHILKVSASGELSQKNSKKCGPQGL